MENVISYKVAGEADIERINQFYTSVYSRIRTYEQFKWEFFCAPAGKAIYIVAEYSGFIVGTQCAIPYWLIDAEGKRILTAKSEDTLVSPLHRGKGIFEGMCQLLFLECKQKNIQCIWGFTYALKTFVKVGFEVPYGTKMMVLVKQPFSSFDYFSAITKQKTFSSKFKILGMCVFSHSKYLASKYFPPNILNINLTESKISLNSSELNYLTGKDTFGIQLNEDFIKYRILNNPYNKNYFCYSYYKNDTLNACLYFNITSQNVGYILQLYFNPSLKKKECVAFLRKCLRKTELGKCISIRFWGFDHNIQNNYEVEMLQSVGFLKLKKGISFVFKEINTTFKINPQNFVLSRMASQGTD